MGRSDKIQRDKHWQTRKQEHKMSILKALTGIVVLPLDIAKDVVTLGGAITEEPSSTLKRLGHIFDNIDEATK